ETGDRCRTADSALRVRNRPAPPVRSAGRGSENGGRNPRWRPGRPGSRAGRSARCTPLRSGARSRRRDGAPTERSWSVRCTSGRLEPGRTPPTRRRAADWKFPSSCSSLEIFHDLSGVLVFLDAVEERLGERLLVFVGRQRAGFDAIAYEEHFDQHARHARADQHVKLRLFDPEVSHFTITSPHLGYNGTLQAVCQRDRIFELQVLHHVAQYELEVGDLVARNAVLARRHAQRRLIVGVVEVIRLDAAGVRIRTRVYMERDEKIGRFRVGDRRPLFERNEAIVLPREHHFYAQRFELLAELLRNAEHDVFFGDAVDADRARVLAAVAGIEDDLPQGLRGGL